MKGTAKSTTFSRPSVMVRAPAMSARFRDEKEKYVRETVTVSLPLIRYCQKLTKDYLIYNF